MVKTDSVDLPKNSLENSPKKSKSAGEEMSVGSVLLVYVSNNPTMLFPSYASKTPKVRK